MDYSPLVTEQLILCCQCGTAIPPNPSNMCLNCIRNEVDITEGIPKQGTLYFCRNCERYLQPPAIWISAQLENAGFIWTEPHSKRVKLKLTIQKEVFASTILQQIFEVEFVVSHQQCNDCARVMAQNTWQAIVQVRQKVNHKRTFLYLEQLILKHNAHKDTINIKEVKDGIDFFYAQRSHAIKMVEFLNAVVPIKFKTSEQLISTDIHSNISNYKFSYSVEIVPICKDDLVCLPLKVARSLGNISPLVVCYRIGNSIHIMDPNTLAVGDIPTTVFWRIPFTSLATPKELTEYYVLDVEPLGPVRGKFVLADIQVARTSDFGRNDTTSFARSHLGGILHPGDTALGYDLSSSNFNNNVYDTLNRNELPDVILIKKSFPNRRKKIKSRNWKLKSLAKEQEEMAPRKQESERMEQDLEMFLRDLEEDPELRQTINLYKNPNPRGNKNIEMDLDGNLEINEKKDEDEEDEENFPDVNLGELLEDLNINDDEYIEAFSSITNRQSLPMTTIPSAHIPPDTILQLNQVLSNLASNDNSLRSAAEQQLNEQWIAQRPDLLLVGLAQLGRNHEATHGRSFSFVLIRRIAFKAQSQASKGEELTIWDLLQETSRQAIKNDLLISLSVEQENTVRHKVCDAVSEVAKNSFLKGQKWTELLPALFEASESPSAEHREAAFRIFSAVPNLITDQPTDILKQIFSANLQDIHSPAGRMAALKAAVAFMLEADKQSCISFAELMPQMLEVLSPLVAQRDEDGLVDGIMVFIELGENLPRVFKPVLINVLPFAVNLMKDKSLEDGTRQTALELLLTLSEASPSMMRKTPDFCAQVIPIALEMMTELEDFEDWYTTDDLEDDDNDENYVIGEHAMDRLARHLGGKAVLPITFQYIPTMLGSERWVQRHAALMAISAIGEGCIKIMKDELGKIIELVSPYLRDPHPRVRYAACNAIGQMSTDFQDTLQKKFHQLVLTHLIPVMAAPEPRVQAHAAAALVNFCEAADKSILEPYLDTIFERLLVLLNSGRTYVQEQAITTIATVADSAEDRFVKYYSAIMPLLINVLRNAHQKEYRLLRGKAMECASLIALAVGKETFATNANEFIELLAQTQQTVSEPDDPQISYLIACWARVCKVLEADFVPYLPIVMPPLLQSAQLKPDFAVLDPDEDIESKYSADDGWEFIGVAGQQIGIKTTVLEEKCTAVEMLICYARELGPAFQPYVENVLDIVLPLLKFYFHDGVRHAAAASIPHLLNSVKKGGASREYLLNMWHRIAEKVIEIIATETDPTFLWQWYVTFYESLETAGENSLTPIELESFTKATESQLKDFFERLKQREEARQSGDYDAEDEDIILEEEATEEGVLSELSKALHVILKTHRSAYLPSFEKLLPIVTSFLADSNPATRQWALCFIDDVVEFTGPASWNYQGHFLEKMIALLLDPAPDVRQAAAYGIGVCAQFGGENYAEASAVSLNPLFQIINASDSRTEENIYATENATSAVTKILKFNSSKFDVNSVIPSWFAALPILNDEEEAPLSYSYLLDLLEAQHPGIFGNNHENIPRIFTVFTDVLSAGILSEDLATRMVNALKVIFGSLSNELKTTLWNSIDPHKLKTLQEMNYF
ncbi:hypothetical protein G9A89_000881 [Geosiphon pyriformis]|nr:hypothetical protein G9A89_000881 [Geosiphon pyriformis]